MFKLKVIKYISDNIIIIKSKDFFKKYHYRAKNKMPLLQIIKKINSISPAKKKYNQIILSLESKASKNKGPNLKILKILKIYMPRLLFNNFNSTKNHPPIIITKDGYGCNFHGYV